MRHGETEWSRLGKHTGRSDIPLTPEGQEMARTLRQPLSTVKWGTVWFSPLSRARETCALAGQAEAAVAEPDLMEWHYGAYEGLTLVQIHAQRPDWNLWRDGAPQGESPAQMATRVERVLARLESQPGPALLFAHGHLLRALTARALALELGFGSQLSLDPASLCQLTREPGHPWSLMGWNGRPGTHPWG